MEQPIIIGLAGVIVFLIIICGMWLLSRKKIRALTEINKLHQSENTALDQKLAATKEIAAKVAPLEKEIATSQKAITSFQEKISKLTLTLQEAEKKNTLLDNISGKLARTKLLVEQMEMTAAQDKETISQLDQQLTASKLTVEEQQTVIDRLKKIYTES
jgi:chromosome segregation ATPase